MDKLPPHNLDAEASLLAAILVDNNTLFETMESVSAEDFYKPAHGLIYQGILDLYSRNEPIDLVTLNNQLKEAGKIEEVGGATYLARMIDTVPLAANARHYANIIHNKATLRRLINNATKIVQKCYEQEGDVDEVLDLAEKAVFEVAEQKSKKSFHTLGELVITNIDELEERQKNKSQLTGVPSGFKDLDTMTCGFQKSDLIILAARPSMGKTALALNIARNAAVDHGFPVAIYSLEMSKEQLSLRLLTAEAKINSQSLRTGFFSKDDWVHLSTAASHLSQAPIYIDDSADINALTIRTKSRKLMMDKGLGLIIIDYLQLMRGTGRTERRELEISEISRSLKALAKEINVPIIALSQLNRMLEQRSDKHPMLSDLRESGALEQDADLVAFIYRDEVYNKEENNPHRGTAEIILGKQRNGPVGKLTLTFLNAYTRFEDFTTPDMLPSG